MGFDIFRKFLSSRLFPFISGGIVLLLVVLTVLSFLPKNKKPNGEEESGRTGLFKLSDLFNFQNRQTLDAQKLIDEQIKVSEEYASWENRVAGKYPWRKKLPLTSDKYFVYFDFIKKSFVARLYPDNDDLIEQIRADITRKLKKDRGIPLENFTVDWDVYPKSSPK